MYGKGVVLIAALVLCATIISGCSISEVQFDRYHNPASMYHSPSLGLVGSLTKPEGEGPFPAVVLLHGCRGITDTNYWWAEILNSEGYATLVVDSLGPRGLSNICRKDTVTSGLSGRVRAEDAYGALRYLKTLPFIDSDRIGVMGWSHGGLTVLFLANEKNVDEFPPGERFGAAAVIYPACFHSEYSLNTDLMVFAGAKDGWTPAPQCEALVEIIRDGGTSHRVGIVVYPNATHAYDMYVPKRVLYGNTLEYDSGATEDTKRRLLKFFKENL